MQQQVKGLNLTKLIEELLVRNYKFQPIGPTDNPSFNSIKVNSLTLGKRVISNPNEKGSAGEVCWDSNYLYVCIDKDTWRRIPLESW